MKEFLKPKREFIKTDLSYYTELTASRVRAALLTKNQQELFPLFNLLVDKDTSLGSECEKRLNSTLNKFFTHDLGESEDENIEEIIKASVEARLYGFSLLELYLENNFIKVSLVDRSYIEFRENLPTLRIGKNRFIAKEPFFITITSNPAMLKTLWIAYAKHYVLSLYLKFAEFLGVPPLIGGATSSDEKTLKQMSEAFENLRSGSYAIFGVNDTIKILEGRGSQEDFMEFIRYCDAEIAKCINGSVLSSNTATTGSYAQGKIHENNRFEIIDADIKFASRQVKNFYSRFNKKANLNIQYEKDKNLLQRAQMLSILYPLGYEMSIDDMAKEFDLPLPKKEKLKSLNYKLPKKPLDKFDEFIESPNFKEPLKGVETMIKDSLNTLLKECNTYEEAFNKLYEIYDGVPLDILENVMFSAMSNAEILGLSDEF
ncbi:phage portal protein family protein [Campylobacter corcagiensis]|uniref:DUF935 family protein n=1 Tax=Campylobacter corcagiensis TaxID=1448857 RepID=A0A7M1LHD8_9BACT|nr:DUF935 family protein [Campylobacter corcagiensis]QKF64570.1 putative phage protein (DUF935 domain) [Campylobacter corcagiensis]QOQ87256.1 DUF935 family protein [Campylobacter corcagiensis]